MSIYATLEQFGIRRFGDKQIVEHQLGPAGRR
jgi:hypothetical protein